MRAEVLTIRNPFDPLGSRELACHRRPRRVRTLAPRGGVPVFAMLNGRPLLRAAWRRRLRDGDQLVFCVLPRGGGGGSNPLRLLLSLALFAFAGWIVGPAGLLGGAAGNVLFGTFTLGQATQLGIIFAGQAAINALLPVATPNSLPAPSPTYSLAAQGNAARIEQAIPVQYGRILAFPDFAAQPYTEFAGDEQYLYQLLCLGAGEYDIEEMRIEDTPISNFAEIETQIIAPNQTVTLFPTAVVSSLEVSGQELEGRKQATYVWSGTTITITQIAHVRTTGAVLALEFLTGGASTAVYQIAGIIDADSFTVTHPTGSGAGDVNVRSVIGGMEGFVAAAAGTVAERLAVDIVLPSGLFGQTEDGLGQQELSVQFEIRQVDDNGVAIGAWISLAPVMLSDRSTTPLRRSYSYPLTTPGRYRFRAWRLDQKDEETAGHDVILAGLRSYLAGDQVFGQVTMIAMRMRATNNLSLQASRKISVIATRKLPVWTGSAWTTPQVTRTEAQMKATFADLRAFLAGLLGADGTAATALDVLGALISGHAAKTAAYAVNTTDRGAVIDASGTWTLSLLATATAGAGFAVVLRNGGAGIITIDPSGAELIDGAATITVGPGRSGLLLCTGTAWLSLGFAGDIAGRVLLADGTTALPGLAFAGDTDTGLTRPAANQIGGVTGAVQRWLLSNMAFQIDVPITGTAVTQTATDSTPGRVQRNGDFGVGGLVPLIGNIAVTDNSIVSGFYSYDTSLGSAGGPGGVTRASLWHTRRAAGGGETQVVVVEASSLAQVVAGMTFSRSRVTGAWTAWIVGGILEVGSNANGRYVKQADGTLTCTHIITTSASAEAVWTFPAAFSTLADLRMTLGVNSSALSSQAPRFANRTVSGVDVSCFNTSNARLATAVEAIAIGRWY